jgi:hypothetical protein
MKPMDNHQIINTNDIVLLQVATFTGAIVTAIQPIISLIFMIVSIISGCILIYKFFIKQK